MLAHLKIILKPLCNGNLFHVMCQVVSQVMSGNLRYLSHVVGEEEMVSEENDRGEELSEVGLVLVRRQQLLQTNLLTETRVTFERYMI